MREYNVWAGGRGVYNLFLPPPKIIFSTLMMGASKRRERTAAAPILITKSPKYR